MNLDVADLEQNNFIDRVGLGEKPPRNSIPERTAVIG
jgi:hypothetical protein